MSVTSGLTTSARLSPNLLPLLIEATIMDGASDCTFVLFRTIASVQLASESRDQSDSTVYIRVALVMRVRSPPWIMGMI